jgi:hypothetical protein
MKTDVALTMDEYLNACYVAPHHIKPPAKDARPVPVAEEKDVELGANARSCNCDRWGHPCPSCVERKIQPRGRTSVVSAAMTAPTDC